MVLNYLEDAWSLPAPRFRVWVLSAKLCHAESGPNFVDNASGKTNRSSLLDPVQNNGFSPGTLFGLVIELSQF
jgi:hypothetical protein